MGRRGFVKAARWALLASLTGCTPGLDWRESRPEHGDWKALFPCRPVHQAGKLAFGEARIDWHVSACQAGGVTWSVSEGYLGDPGQVRLALGALRQQLQARFPGAPSTPVRQLVPGMTPQPEAGRWRLSASDAGGAPMVVEQGLFAHGANVLQVLLIGPALSPEAAQAFFEGLSFPP